MHLKNKRKRKHKKYIIFLILILLIYLFKKTYNFTDIITNYSTEIAKSYVIDVINETISKTSCDTKNLYTITRNNKEEIEMIDYNNQTLSNYINDLTLNIEENLNKKFKNAYIKVPIGVITKNAIFNNYGPKIKANLTILNSITAGIKVNVKDYGINNALLETILIINVEVQVILPVSSKEIKIAQEIPLSYKIISAKVPDFFTSYSPNY